MGQLGVTKVKLKSHHLLRDWPILKVCEKKILQSTEIALSSTLDFQVSPLAIDKTATKNQAKIQLARAHWGPGIWLGTTTHLAKLANTVLFFPEHKCPSQEKD